MAGLATELFRGYSEVLFGGIGFVDEHGAVMTHDAPAHTAVVVLVRDASAAAGIVQFLRDERLIIAVLVLVRVDNLSARRFLTPDDGCEHRSPPYWRNE
jgi:hypothetical protein